jgi:hypothetical protein
MSDSFEIVDQYVAAQPPEVQAILEAILSRVRQLVPGGEEVISYQIPTIKLEREVPRVLRGMEVAQLTPPGSAARGGPGVEGRAIPIRKGHIAISVG